MKVSGNAIVKHAKTGKTYEITSDMLDFRGVERHERAQGPEIRYSATLHHPELGELEWDVWEYPAGVYNTHEFPVDTHEMIEDNIRFEFIENPGDEIDE